METYEKIDDNTLKVTNNDTTIHIYKESRAEIQTQIDHLKLDKDKMEFDYKNKIDALKAKIAILDGE